jgi:hypothetical protein
MITEIKNEYSTMFLSTNSIPYRYTIIVYYNHYSLFDINLEGLSHRYGEGDSRMDLNSKKGLKVIGIDFI